MGFTYEEAVALRRIEMTLSRWAEAECNGEIERSEKSGKPFRRCGNYVQANDPRSIYFVADREAGALRRLKAIVGARNARNGPVAGDSVTAHQSAVFFYHQTDPRGCALYLVTNAQLAGDAIDSVYTRGLAVCA